MTTKRTRKTPANLFALLQLAAQPGARLLVVASKAFIINGKTHKYMREATYKILLEEGWINTPRQIAPDLAESSVTREGYSKLAAMEAHKRKYTQLMFPIEVAQSAA